MNALSRHELVTSLNYWNPWWRGEVPASGIPRDALENLKPWIGAGKAIAVCGMRRSGKTTLLRQLVLHLIENRRVSPRDLLYVNLEDPVFLESQDAPTFLDDLLQAFLDHARPVGTPHLLLDEIQNVKHWARWVRVAVDRGSPQIYLSGSSSKLLEPDLASVLTGRHRQITLWPFSFREVCRAKGLSLVPGSIQPIDERKARALLAEYLQHGGLPEVVLTEDPVRREELPKDIFRDILYRDIVGRHSIRSIGALEGLAQYLLANTARSFTYNRLKDRFGLGIDQVRNYVDYFEQSYLIGQLPQARVQDRIAVPGASESLCHGHRAAERGVFSVLRRSWLAGGDSSAPEASRVCGGQSFLPPGQAGMRLRDLAGDPRRRGHPGVLPPGSRT